MVYPTLNNSYLIPQYTIQNRNGHMDFLLLHTVYRKLINGNSVFLVLEDILLPVFITTFLSFAFILDAIWLANKISAFPIISTIFFQHDEHCFLDNDADPRGADRKHRGTYGPWKPAQTDAQKTH